MGSIDAHAHQVPLRFLERAAELGVEFPLPAVTADEHLRVMDETGCELAVVSLPPPGPLTSDPRATGELARTINDAWADLVARHPGRFAALASLPLPDVGESLLELERALDGLGLDGVTLFTSNGGVPLADPGNRELLAALDARSAHVLLHPADGPWAPPSDLPNWLFELPLETTRCVAEMLFAGVFQEFPRISWQLSHAGGAIPFLAHRLDTLGVRAPEQAAHLRTPPVAQLRRLYYDTAQADNGPALAGTLALAGPDRIVFGTDWPYAVLAPGSDPQPEVTSADPRILRNALAMASSVAARQSGGGR